MPHQTMRAALLIGLATFGLQCSLPGDPNSASDGSSELVLDALADGDALSRDVSDHDTEIEDGEGFDLGGEVDTTDADGSADVLVPLNKVMGWVTAEQIIFGPDSVSTLIRAEFSTAASPVAQEVLMDDGVCQLLAWKIHFCDPVCGAQWCTGPGECTDFPEHISAGTLTVQGGTKPYELEPDYSGRYWLILGEPLFTPSIDVSVSAEGESVAGFTVTIPWVEPMVLKNAQAMQWFGDIDPTTDFEVRWVPGIQAPQSRVRIQWEADTAAHALPDARSLRCDVSDTGSMTISQPLLAAFLDPSHHGGENGPDSTISRYRSQSVTTAGGDVVEFRVLSSVRVDQ